MSRAEELRRVFGALLIRCDENSFRVTLSIGVTVTPPLLGNTEWLLQTAEAALEAAKQGGRDRACVAPTLKMD